mmetsp:Transcript_24531/g.23587  ORF Transcript_24531/g.23587 Transcript_24531/m.23587 type:complete len:85 (-) Transcript_24531:1167-1421(-)
MISPYYGMCTMFRILTCAKLDLNLRCRRFYNIFIRQITNHEIEVLTILQIPNISIRNSFVLGLNPNALQKISRPVIQSREFDLF